MSDSAAPAPGSNSCSCSPPIDQRAVQESLAPEGADQQPTEINPKWAALLGASSSSSAAASAAAASSAAPVPAVPAFEWQRHVNFFAMHLKRIPQGYESLDTSRMTLLYFCLSALDVLGALDEIVFSKGLAPSIIEWIYAQQVHPYVDPESGEEILSNCGFRGGPSIGVPFEPHRTTGHPPSAFPYDEAHIAMSYTALCSLRILRDDFSRVNKRALIAALGSLQQDDGSFSATRQRSEADMRFLYCACAISAMLRDWRGFDVQRSVRFVQRCQSYDGGIGLCPGAEGHGGSTYCAVASLVLMDQFSALPSPHSLLKWLLSNQGSGWRGRPNKPSDSCYSFWLGATLRIVAAEMGVDAEAWTKKAENREFNLTCQNRIGGFSKESDGFPDLLHSYMALSGLSLIGLDSQLQSIDCLLGLTHKSAGDSNQRLSGSW